MQNLLCIIGSHGSQHVDSLHHAQCTLNNTPWVKKGCHPNHGYNFVNSWRICTILSLLQRAVNFQQKQY